MAKSKFTTEQLEAITQLQQKDGITRKSAIRKYQKQLKAAVKAQPKAKVASKPQSQKTTNANRAAGIALFNLAGRPSKSDFIKVYGKRGHLMTWTEREAAGVSAEDFQKALASR
jgi:hypothetical protein